MLVSLGTCRVVFVLDFLKVVRLVFWSGVVGPGTTRLSLARASRSYDRASRAQSRYALKSSTCEQVYVCLFIMEEKVMDSVEFSEFNWLCQFFFKTLWIPRVFFVGWKGKGGSLVTFLSWFLLQSNLGEGSEPIGPLSLVSPSQCCISLFFAFFLQYGTWSQAVECRDKRLTHLYPINRRSQWQIKGRGPRGPGGPDPFLSFRPNWGP